MQENSWLLIPWLLVFLIHGLPVFVFLLVTTVFSVIHYTTRQPSSAPLLEVTSTPLDCVLLLLTCLLIPLGAVLPVRAFIYLDTDRRICPCYPQSEEARQLPPAGEEEEVLVSSDGEDQNDVPWTSSYSGLVPRLNSVIRSSLEGRVRPPGGTTSLSPVTVPRVHSLYDLSSLHELASSEGGEADQPPPSYSQAEGLDCPPPDYSEVEVGRLRLGRYIIVMDHNNRNVKRFKI